jgi:hypothetical protein
MRKIALSFAALAVLFITNASGAWSSERGSNVGSPE